MLVRVLHLNKNVTFYVTNTKVINIIRIKVSTRECCAIKTSPFIVMLLLYFSRKCYLNVSIILRHMFNSKRPY